MRARSASCALSRDGLRAVTGSADKTARVWDTQTGATVAQLNGHSADISYVAFTADGGKIRHRRRGRRAEMGCHDRGVVGRCAGGTKPRCHERQWPAGDLFVRSESRASLGRQYRAGADEDDGRRHFGHPTRSGRRTRARRRRRHFHRALRAGKRQPPPRVPGACQQGAQRCNQSRRAADRVGRRRSDGAHLERTERHAADRACGCQIQA